MYFLGAEHLVACFIPMWNRIGEQYGNNHIVAAAFPNDSDGNAFRAVFPPIAKGGGLHDRPVDAVRRRADQLHVDDLAVQERGGRLLHQRPAAARLRHHVDPVPPAGLPAPSSPPWPRCCCSRPTPTRWARKVYNIATDSWWVPVPAVALLPHRADLPAAGGPVHLGRQGPAEREHQQLHPLRDRVRGAHLGERPARQGRGRGGPVQGQPARGGGGPDQLHLDSKTNPAPGVAITPPVGIQWQKGTTYPLEAKVVDNTLQPQAKITGDLLPTFK